MGTIKLLEMAIYKEIAAFDFYREVEERVQNPAGRKIFRNLKEEERKHRQILEGWFRRESGQVFQFIPSKEELLFHFPEKFVLTQSSALEALSVGIQSEKDSVNFYSSWMKQTEDPELKKTLKELSLFEERHYLRLQKEHDAVLNNFYWI